MLKRLTYGALSSNVVAPVCVRGCGLADYNSCAAFFGATERRYSRSEFFLSPRHLRASAGVRSSNPCKCKRPWMNTAEAAHNRVPKQTSVPFAVSALIKVSPCRNVSTSVGPVCQEIGRCRSDIRRSRSARQRPRAIPANPFVSSFAIANNAAGPLRRTCGARRR